MSLFNRSTVDASGHGRPQVLCWRVPLKHLLRGHPRSRRFVRSPRQVSRTTARRRILRVFAGTMPIELPQLAQHPLKASFLFRLQPDHPPQPSRRHQLPCQPNSDAKSVQNHPYLNKKAGTSPTSSTFVTGGSDMERGRIHSTAPCHSIEGRRPQCSHVTSFMPSGDELPSGTWGRTLSSTQTTTSLKRRH